MSDQEVRWCPGCGDYSILAQTQKVMPDFGVPAREHRVHLGHRLLRPAALLHEHLRLPHHPRPRARRSPPGSRRRGPELMVWVITGDGDALSIGGNHVHARDAPQRGHQAGDVQQPHLRPDQGPGVAHVGVRQEDQVDARRAPSTRPSCRCRVAITAEATFVARSVDTHTEHLQDTLIAAGYHRGSAFVEVLQNCNIFNDGAWRSFTEQGRPRRQRCWCSSTASR